MKNSKSQQTLRDILTLLEQKKYHGHITIHYAHGKPKKIEYRTVENLDDDLTAT